MFQKSYWERKEIAKRRQADHPVIAAYVKPKINAVLEYVPVSNNTRLLDLGSGNGFFSYYLGQLCNVCAVDYSEAMLQRNPVSERVIMDAANLAFTDRAFDVVFCCALLHHVANPQKIVQEMARVSKKYVVILEPNRNNPLMFLYAALVREERKALHSHLPFLKKLAQTAGLRVITGFSQGIIVPLKTPQGLLPLLSMLDGKSPLGITSFVIAMKD